jgi:hypothetical protein
MKSILRHSRMLCHAWNNLVPTRKIFVIFEISGFFENLLEILLKSDKNHGYFT